MPESGRPGGGWWWIATAGGVGRAPLAPGTFGSLVGVALVWIAGEAAGAWGVVGLAVAATAFGVVAADRVSRGLGVQDPGCVVIDEIAGQALALAFVPLTPSTAVAGFLAFRAFDIIKPPPCRRLERLHGGVGIVADDLMAGVYAAVVVHGIVALAPGVIGVP